MSNDKSDDRGDGLRDLGHGVLEIVDAAAMQAALGPSIQRNLAAQDDAPAAQEGEGWSGSIGGACPVQGDGQVDGLPWYFRARGRHWSLSVGWRADADAAAVWATGDAGWYIEGESDEKDEFAASWMRHGEAWRHITEAIALFRDALAQRRVERASQRARGRLHSRVLLQAVAAALGGVSMALPFTSNPEFADAGPFDHARPSPPADYWPPVRRPQQPPAPPPAPRVPTPKELAAQAKRDRKNAKRRGAR